jgi:hypothetical protein
LLAVSGSAGVERGSSEEAVKQVSVQAFAWMKSLRTMSAETSAHVASRGRRLERQHIEHETDDARHRPGGSVRP